MNEIILKITQTLFYYVANERFQFSCHLDDRINLFVRRDLSSHTRRNDSNDAAFCHLHVVPNLNWVNTLGDRQIESRVVKV